MITICPKCLVKVKGDYFKKNNKLFLIKKCPKHGVFKTLISNDITYYKKLEKYYLNSKLNKDVRYIHLNIFDKDYKLKLINIIKQKNQRIYLTTQEPRNKKDILNKKDPINHKKILNIIKTIKQSGNKAILFSKSDLNNKFVKNLKNNGINEIHLEIIDYKIIITTLNNLKKNEIKTSLEVYIEDINKKQIDKILRYTKKNKFIKGIFFKIIGKPILDDLINCFVEITKISKKKILNVQRLFYSLRKKRCFYNQYYPIFRKDFSFFIVGFLKVCNKDNFDSRYVNCAGKEIINDKFVSLANAYITK